MRRPAFGFRAPKWRRASRTLAAGLILIGAAIPLTAAGSLRVADVKSLPGAAGVVFEELEVIAEPRGLGYVLTLLFDSDEIVSHRLGAGSSLNEVGRVPTCDGPRRLLSIGNFGSSIQVNGTYLCSGSNEIAGFDVGQGGVIDVGTPIPSGGTDPADLSVSLDGRFVLVANRGSGDLATVRIDPATGALTPVGSASVGGGPDLVAVSRSGIAFVGRSVANDVSQLRIDPATGALTPVGSVPLGLRASAIALGDLLSEVSPNSTRSVAGRAQLLYVGVRSNQMGVQDEIRTFRVGSDGALTFAGSTPAGAFLTDIAVTYDRLFAVTVNSASQRDEVRAYRRVGTQLILDASLETPESPSFKQIASAPSQGRVTTLFVTGYQAGWLRSIEYTRDDDPVCTSVAEVLCMNGNRFEVSVDWNVASQNLSGRGIAVPLTSDTGSFWFFSSNNIELVIKVVDGRAFNDFFWVFYGALSNVEYTITVTDTATGRVRTYANPLGTLASVADVTAFPGGAAGAASAAPPHLDGLGAELVRAKSGEVAAILSGRAAVSSSSSPSAFSVRIDWRVPSQGKSGVGQGVVVTPNTAYFWFFSPNNVEVMIKVVDGRAFNGRYWVFYGALSDVEYTITVTNLANGAQKTYFNPSGTLASVADTAAFLP